MLSEQTREHHVLANDNRRIEPDVWSGPTIALGHALRWAIAIALVSVALAYLLHAEWFWELI